MQAAANAAETAELGTHWLADLPNVPASSATAAGIRRPVDAAQETEEGLFARMTALKANPAVPAEDLATLTDRLDALKGPKVSAAELPDLRSRLEDLKGAKNTLPLPELEDRLAKLKGISDAPTSQLGQLKGRSQGALIPDFDPDVELNQDQLEALAGMNDKNAENAPFATCLAESIVQAQAHQNAEHLQHSVTMPTSQPRPLRSFGASSSELQQVLQDFDPEGNDGISEQQLRALASMQAKGAAGVPKWAAALGLSAQDLHTDSDVDKCSQSESCGSDSDGSSDHGKPCETGRRGRVGSAARQAQPKKQMKPKQAHQKRQS